MKPFFAILAILIAMVGLGWLLNANDYFMARTFAPKMEQVRHDTFKNSQAYNDGAVSELENMRFEYLKTSDRNAKAAMADIIIRRATTYGVEKLPRDLRVFVDDLMRARDTEARY